MLVSVICEMRFQVHYAQLGNCFDNTPKMYQILVLQASHLNSFSPLRGINNITNNNNIKVQQMYKQ